MVEGKWEEGNRGEKEGEGGSVGGVGVGGCEGIWGVRDRRRRLGGGGM